MLRKWYKKMMEVMTDSRHKGKSKKVDITKSMSTLVRLRLILKGEGLLDGKIGSKIFNVL